MNANPPRTIHAYALIAVLFGVTLAGCLSTTDPDCTGDVCMTEAQPGDAFLTNATRETASFDSCVGQFAANDFPAQQVEHLIPPEFVPASLVPGMGQLRMLAISCPRGEVAGIVLEPIRILYTSLGVEPLDQEWSGGVISEYLFEVFVNEEAVADALTAWSLPAFVADITIDSNGPDAMSVESWNVVASDRSYAFDFLRDGESQGRIAGPAVYWTGNGEISRTDVNRTIGQSRVFYGLESIAMTGDAVFSSILGAPMLPMRMQAYNGYQTEWSPYPNSFTAD